MGASPPAYYLFCTLVPLATLIVRAPLLNHFRATKHRLEAILWQLDCADIEDPEEATLDHNKGGGDHSNYKSDLSTKRAHRNMLQPSAMRALCCGCGWQRCCCGGCWAIDSHRAFYDYLVNHTRHHKPHHLVHDEPATLSSTPVTVTSEPASTSIDHAPAAVMEIAEQEEASPLRLLQPYKRPPCCGRSGACGVCGIFCGLGFHGVYLPHALAALEPLVQASTIGLPLLAIVSVEWCDDKHKNCNSELRSSVTFISQVFNLYFYVS